MQKTALDSHIELTIDGTKHSILTGSTIGEILEYVKEPPKGQLIVIVARDKMKAIEKPTNYKLETSRGEIIVKINKENLGEWRNLAASIKGLNASWITTKVVALGSFKTDLTPSRELKPLFYDKWDVGLSLAGADPANTHLLLIKEKHEAYHIHPTEIRVLGKVVAGRYIVNSLTLEDQLKTVEPIVEMEEYSTLIRRVDSMVLKIFEPVDIYTCLKIKAFEEAQKTVEHLYSAAEDGTLKVDDTTASYVRCEKLVGTKLLPENYGKRMRGFITVRNGGEKAGAIFFYKESRPPANSHNIVGFVESGVELLDATRKSDTLTVRITPKKVNVLGLTQKNAERELSSLLLKQERCGITDDDAIIVEQEPLLTFEAYRKGAVKTFGADSEKILKIKNYFEAPQTAKYLDTITGLIYAKIGRLKVYFALPNVDFILFSGEPYPFQLLKGELRDILHPENTPKAHIDMFELGVTNIVKKQVGIIGIRLKPSSSFGPTGEDFNGTNLVASVVGGFDGLRNLKEGDIVYIMKV